MPAYPCCSSGTSRSLHGSLSAFVLCGMFTTCSSCEPLSAENFNLDQSINMHSIFSRFLRFCHHMFQISNTRHAPAYKFTSQMGSFGLPLLACCQSILNCRSRSSHLSLKQAPLCSRIGRNARSDHTHVIIILKPTPDIDLCHVGAMTVRRRIIGNCGVDIAGNEIEAILRIWALKCVVSVCGSFHRFGAFLTIKHNGQAGQPQLMITI
jgi:hypothetical protein